MNTKQQLRNDIKTIFSGKNSDILSADNEKIIANILEYISKYTYSHICIYENMTDEVATTKLISTLRSQGINIYTPQMIGDTEMILIDDNYELYEKEIDLFIVPGRAFSTEGKRLGRGRGYYDRFLSQKLYKKSKKLGICYDFQVKEDIPTQKHDISMDSIISSNIC